MLTVPIIPDTAPFTGEQRAWLNGYLAGLFSRGPVNAAATAPAAPTAAPLKPLTILFGSQTGTAETLAKKAARTAGKRGFAATVMDMAAFTPAQLAQEENILVIASTYGEGEPPDNAKALHAALTAAHGADSSSPVFASVSADSATPTMSTSANARKTSTSTSKSAAQPASLPAPTAISITKKRSPPGSPPPSPPSPAPHPSPAMPRSPL
jgi:sulfite reductase (NADPH) flavoprotein alpha-component